MHNQDHKKITMHKYTRCILGNPLGEENPTNLSLSQSFYYVKSSLGMPLENAMRVKA